MTSFYRCAISLVTALILLQWGQADDSINGPDLHLSDDHSSVLDAVIDGKQRSDQLIDKLIKDIAAETHIPNNRVPAKKSTIFRFGKRNTIFRFGKRDSRPVFRFGKRSSDPFGVLDQTSERRGNFRIDSKRSDVPLPYFRYGRKRSGSWFRYGKRADGSLFRYGKREAIPNLYYDDVVNKGRDYNEKSAAVDYSLLRLSDLLRPYRGIERNDEPRGDSSNAWRYGREKDIIST